MAIQPVPPSTSPPLTPALAQSTAVNVVTPASVPDQPAQNTPLTPEQIEQTVDEIRRQIQPVDQNLLFTIDKETGKTIVRLIDSSTKEILRQIPSEELIAIARALGKSHSGLIERQA
ncbi:MAG: flagellar protein FlaG [Pseudomonadota bacterium]